MHAQVHEPPSRTRLERDRYRADNQRLRQQNAELLRLLEAVTGISTIIPDAYSHALVTCYSLATGSSSSTQERTIRTRPNSSPPPHSAAMFAIYTSERRHLRYRATLLDAHVDRLRDS